ncbi:MAG: 2-oxoacid:acceptor oxidoreductase subunit alpha [Flavobacteriales bacterium]|nr:2-oxoacid:acceptor oxidoreductase subunit alpha [Flavobacteriia bacterium]NCP05849.1 2-oxoacid:acceptor oxidoreductase subunit alpha [Flavobacteriales bacterium]PIV93200.1 MAG: 2-oxoacid:acceptor oxidoreductase subunit alpha [Flavobacteriaceae bacterium CG17_big_fil_post_rev_8_21_14_2_50_33_15]PIY12491.1 MAG: 2-oxoacid:acceptor oxidoreductase subunit alpha [Flavobacteriaceae bacterium CG_4_10_14_3_um_filter_33_47]PJB19753.1 MAG: 2-oxoacid:acceptor oxidoreductase subunit alpha [Flavobacteriac
MITEKLKLQPEVLEAVVIRFVGDSGDGMQLTGTQFSDTSAMFGNDIATFPNYPSEIRAPQGSLYGVSGFQVHIGSVEVSTPGDNLDLLVAMNPAGLKTNLYALKPGHTIIVDTDAFNKKNLEKAQYETNPLEDHSLDNYRVIQVDMTSLTKEALKNVEGLDNKAITRSKNMFALGMVYWMYGRAKEHTIDFFNKKFKTKPHLIEANTKVLNAGYYFAETLELIPNAYTISPAKMPSGTYRVIMGNTATAWGFLAAAEKSGLELFLGSYPITPATDILHEMVKHKHFGVKAFQAEDEIAGIASAIGAAFAGDLAITTTSGPGLALKGEALGLAMIMELPLVVVNVQRGGPSTGLPTKTEQSDLMQAMYGRNGESPVIVIAASTPANCFNFAFQAAKLALEHMTPVILLTDGYIANGSAPWKIQSIDELPEIKNNITKTAYENWQPYTRNQDTLARNWGIPGTPGFEHRIGGLEKDSVTGNVNQAPENHEKMTKIRAEKVKRVQNYIPEIKTEFADSGDLLVVGWGGTYGSLHSAVKQINLEGYKNIGFAHFNYINPLPKNTEALFKRFKKILVCELNNGQFVNILRMNFNGFEFLQFNKIQGLPFGNNELIDEFKKLVK